MNLSHKVVVITGGTQGFGKVLATALHNLGAHVIVCGRNITPKELVDQRGIHEVQADVTKQEDVERLMATAQSLYGNVDIWVNNAGTWLTKAPIEDTDWDKAHALMEVNLFGTVYGSLVALRAMKKAKQGLIINILSTSALEGKLGSAAYCASKYAARGFTEVLRGEVATTGVHVIAAYPGGMQTDFFGDTKPDNYQKYMKPEVMAEKLIQHIENELFNEDLIVRNPL